MNKVLAIVIAAATLTVASASFAQDKSANTFGGASFESVPNSYETDYGYGAAPMPRRIVVPTAPRSVIFQPQRESGRSKRS